MSIRADELEAELQRLAPSQRPEGKEWFTVARAAEIWQHPHAAAAQHIRRQVLAGTMEAWSGNHRGIEGWYRLAKKPKTIKNPR